MSRTHQKKPLARGRFPRAPMLRLASLFGCDSPVLVPDRCLFQPVLRTAAACVGLLALVSACTSDPPKFEGDPMDTDNDANSSSDSVDPEGDSAGDASVEPAADESDGSAASSDTDGDDTDSMDVESDDESMDTDSSTSDETDESNQCEPGHRRPCAADGALGNCAKGEQSCQENATWGDCSIQPSASDDCADPGDDADCDGTPNSGCECTDGDEQSCGPSEAVGRCMPGVSVCVDGTYQPCAGAVEAGPRDCSSSEDNDCDGTADNTTDGVCRCEPGTTRPCDEHPGLDGNGPCEAGSQTCVAVADGSSSDWTECTGSVGPELRDACDGTDDSDCNGVPNEGCSCTSDADCDDDASCTQDTCEDGACVSSVQSGFCRISGQCISHNAQDPSNPCRYCDATLNQTAWTNSAPGTSCDDGTWCNGTDSCNGSGQCSQHQFATDRCADESGPCVLDSCDETNRTCFRGTDFVCDMGMQQHECIASANTCGSDVRAFSVQRHCDGEGGQCLGAYQTAIGATQDCGSGYCDGSTFTCRQLGCGDTWCDDGQCWTTQDADELMTREEAADYCASLNLHGEVWRLPTISEWLSISRGCNDINGQAIDDVTYGSTCSDWPCDNSCPESGGPGPNGCYWPDEMGTCSTSANGRYWSNTPASGYLWINNRSVWVYSLSDVEPLSVRCVTSGSGP